MTIEDMSPDEAKVIVEDAYECYAGSLDQLVRIMWDCPFSDHEQRWAAAVTIVDRTLRDPDGLTLLAATALERLSRTPEAGEGRGGVFR